MPTDDTTPADTDICRKTQITTVYDRHWHWQQPLPRCITYKLSLLPHGHWRSMIQTGSPPLPHWHWRSMIHSGNNNRCLQWQTDTDGLWYTLATITVACTDRLTLTVYDTLWQQ